MADASMTGMAAADGGMSLGSVSSLWLVVFALLLPIIALMVLIGLLYEVVIRVAGRRLPGWLDWLLAGAAGVAIVVGVGWWVLNRV
jgi:hypothetical protein